MGTLKTHQKNQGENDEPFVILRFSEQIDQNKEQQKIPVIQLAQAEFVQQTGVNFESLCAALVKSLQALATDVTSSKQEHLKRDEDGANIIRGQ